MRFFRTQHDGLYAVINRKEKAKIVFNRGEFATEDKEQIEFLKGMGYAHDPEEKKAKGKDKAE